MQGSSEDALEAREKMKRCNQGQILVCICSFEDSCACLWSSPNGNYDNSMQWKKNECQNIDLGYAFRFTLKHSELKL